MNRITVEALGKKYKTYEKPYHRFLEAISSRKFYKEKVVLEDISFKVKEGESIGVIGHNGAGKSTLLKLLTGVTQPSSGRFEVNGKVSALLELGMGFHPDFTGYQNAVMALQMQGFNNTEIESILPEIEKFAEIGDYFSQSIRTYSSGMMVRLGFAVATSIRPEVLIVDEALSVGDAYFQHKCFDRIKEFKKQGTTIFFVSHDPGSVKNLCDRALLIENGRLIKEGNPDDILDFYNAIIAKRESDYQIKENQGTGIRSGNGKVSIDEVQLYVHDSPVNAIQVGEEVRLTVKYHAQQNDLEDLTVGFMIKDRIGNEIFGTNTFYLGRKISDAKIGVEKEVSFYFNANLGVGTYSITVAAHAGNSHINDNYDWWEHSSTFQVIAGTESKFVGVNFLSVKAEII
ncbi:ABC transporter ATP-binding protein [Paenibacillus sp. HGF5]|uniref:ABC transporter ATP-binding protein n=1 Tax=Paenibacillus sp. HGF5 TaxID=908341 RepID=UPI0002072381|nr:ABC transporter ATP-binding protein [Paenibacillus sp. HGF5]EGG32443.1 ABC transporter, ATP-binding protein [Paenibacillus sp. HGF5]